MIDNSNGAGVDAAGRGFFGEASASSAKSSLLIAPAGKADSIAHLVGQSGGRALAHAAGRPMGRLPTWQLERAMMKQVKAYAVARLDQEVAAALEMGKAKVTLAVTLFKEALSVEHAEVKNRRRLDIDHFLGQIQQQLMEQKDRQIDAAFDHLEASEAKLRRQYANDDPRLAVRLQILAEDAGKVIETARMKVDMIMRKACAEFEETLSV